MAITVITAPCMRILLMLIGDRKRSDSSAAMAVSMREVGGGKEAGCELSLFARRRAPANRPGNGGRVEDAVPQRGDGLRGGSQQRDPRLRLEQEDVAAMMGVPETAYDVDRIDRL